MEELDFENQSLEEDGGYTPSDETTGGDVITPSDDYIPLSTTEDNHEDYVEEKDTISSILGVTDSEIEGLSHKSVSTEDTVENNDKEDSSVELGRKCCPTRHGCQGATDCDYAYGSYPF